MRDDEIRDLVTNASNGDSEAIETLLPRYMPRLEAYLRLRSGAALLARESVSDLAQSVCRDVLENMDRYRYRSEENFRRWLYTTAARKVADRYAFWQAQKRDARQEVGLDDQGAGMQDFLSLCTPSRDAAAREELAAVERALESLPEDQREVILLSRVLGLKRAEVATVLGRTEGSVRMLLSRALAKVAMSVAADS